MSEMLVQNEEVEQREAVDTPNDEVEQLKARIAELEAKPLAILEPERDYVWPQPTEEQKRRLVPGGQVPTRVVKITYADVRERFDQTPQGKTVRIGQYRVPRADKQWDVDRLFLELRRNKLMLLEDAFPEAPHYCETNDCWNVARQPNGTNVYDGLFCSAQHALATLNAHERVIRFE